MIDKNGELENRSLLVHYLYVPSDLIHFKGFYERHRCIRGEQDVPYGVPAILDEEGSYRYIS